MVIQHPVVRERLFFRVRPPHHLWFAVGQKIEHVLGWRRALLGGHTHVDTTTGLGVDHFTGGAPPWLLGWFSIHGVVNTTTGLGVDHLKPLAWPFRNRRVDATAG